jgi:phenylacetic acid degradation operon negative regulatory protein
MLQTDQNDRFSAPELVLSIMDSSKDPVLNINQLVSAGALFGIHEGAIRVAVTRLTQDGVLEQQTRGAYSVGPYGAGLHATVSTWKTVEDQVIDWGGDWLAVFTGNLKRTNKKQVRARERALRLRGFAAFDRGLSLRPANFAASTAQIRAQLSGLGLEDDALVFQMADVDAREANAFKTLWDTTALEHQYQEYLDAMGASADGLYEKPIPEAARESLALGKRITRDILLDPLLPPEMIDVALRRNMVEAMIEYDRLAKGLWARFYQVESLAD